MPTSLVTTESGSQNPTMNRPPTDKRFDCLAFRWDVQSRINEEIKDLSPEEQTAYLRRRAAWFTSRREPAAATRPQTARAEP